MFPEGKASIAARSTPCSRQNAAAASDVLSFSETQQVVESCVRREIEDTFSLQAGPPASARRFLLQDRASRDEPDFRKTEEDEAQDRLRVLGRGQTGVRTQLVCRPQRRFSSVPVA